MPRSDLNALTADDLVTLANRGMLRRAERDLETAPPNLEEREDLTIVARWSDGANCTLPPGSVLSDQLCTCLATSVCHHLLGTVLAYQRQSAGTAPPPVATWDPGALDDTLLARYFKKPAFSQTRKWFEAGQVVELVRSSKPLARLHSLGHTVRFLVPEDLAYARCNCPESPPCRHVLLAVLAFRRLRADLPCGLIEIGAVPPVNAQLLAALDEATSELLIWGLSGCSAAQAGRWWQLEAACRKADLVWPAEILAELLLENERYTNHDAHFSGVHAVELLGELCIRLDAIAHPTDAVPQLFVRGAHSDQVAPLKHAQLVGLGTGAQVLRRGVRLLSYFQDAATGEVLTVGRDFLDPAADSGIAPHPLAQLARSPALKDIPFTRIGASQLLVQGGKRTPDRQFLSGRAPLAVHSQTFQWQNLKAPVLVEDFEELVARMHTLPPRALRPRHFGENFFVFAVSAVESVQFVSSEQSVQAILRDRSGHRLHLQHPFTARGAGGTESLLARLQSQSPCFVSGLVDTSTRGPVVKPVALIFESGATRTLVQPWIDGTGEGAGSNLTQPAVLYPADPLRIFLEEALFFAAEVLVVGLARSNARTLQQWHELQTLATRLGFVALLEPMVRVAQVLQHPSDNERYLAIQLLLEIVVFVQLAQEVVVFEGMRICSDSRQC